VGGEGGGGGGRGGGGPRRGRGGPWTLATPLETGAQRAGDDRQQDVVQGRAEGPSDEPDLVERERSRHERAPRGEGAVERRRRDVAEGQWRRNGRPAPPPDRA